MFPKDEFGKVVRVFQSPRRINLKIVEQADLHH